MVNRMAGDVVARDMNAYTAYTREEFATDPWKPSKLLPANGRGHRNNFITQIQKWDPARQCEWGVHPGLGGSADHSFRYPPFDLKAVKTAWVNVEHGAPDGNEQCRIYAPRRVYEASGAPIKVSVLFSPDSFADSRVGVRAMLRESTTSSTAIRVLVVFPSRLPAGNRYGWPATDFVIKSLLQDINLGDRSFQVDVLAAYSAGHRGMHLTLWNLDHLTSLAPEPTLIYFDNLYRLADGRTEGPFTTKAALTHLKDTLAQRFQNRPHGPRFAVYAGTEGGFPAPSKSLREELATLFDGRSYFVDMRPASVNTNQSSNNHRDLMMLTYGRIFEAARMEGFFSSLPPPSAPLVGKLPERGTLFSSSKCPPWIPPNDWKGLTLEKWSSDNAGAIIACDAKKQAWLETYLFNQEERNKMIPDPTKWKRDYRLLGFDPPNNGLVVHDGLVQEFAWELMLR